MRLRHFEELRPLCPRCRSATGEQWSLRLATIAERNGDSVLEGVLHCSNPQCQMEFPIIDGMPVIVADVRSLLRDQIESLTARADLTPATWSLLGDAAGPGSLLDVRRQHLSIYGWDGYGEFDAAGPREPPPGAVVRCLHAGLEQTGPLHGPILDLGCGAGRSTFELAAGTDELVLGVDLGHTLLKLAHGVARDGTARYPLRRSGLVYDQRDVRTPFAHAGNVDFWLCDAVRPPFADATFGSAVALNLLDCVADPLGLLDAIGRSLRTGSRAIVTTPYDWSTAATPVEAWLGGHSQRAPAGGRPETVLRSLLSSPGGSGRALVMRSELDRVAWHTRLHDRSVMHYDVHLVALEVVDEGAAL